MKKAQKWIRIAAVFVFGFIIIALAALYIYEPGLRNSWVKPGIAQEKIPSGIETSVVFEEYPRQKSQGSPRVSIGITVRALN